MKRLIPPTVKEYRDHARALARAFKVLLLLTPDAPRDFAMATFLDHSRREFPVVLAKSITDETSYAVVMHELGHLLAPAGTLRGKGTAKNRNLMLDEERAAWEWAEHHALDWTVAMQQVARFSLDSYEKGNV